MYNKIELYNHEAIILADVFHFIGDIEKYRISTSDFTNERYRLLFCKLLEMQTLDHTDPFVLIREIGQKAGVSVDDLLEEVPTGMAYHVRKARELRRADMLKELACEVDVLDEMEIVTRLGGLYAIAPKSANVLTGEQLLTYYQNYLDIAKQRTEEGKTGLLTGFKRLDEWLSLQPGNFIILAARPSVGKSALAINQAVGAAMYGQKVLYVSTEMSGHEIMNRVFAGFASISNTRFKYATYTDSDMVLCLREFKQIKDNFKLIYAPGSTSKDVLSFARTALPFDIVIIDHMDLLRDERIKGETEATTIGRITSSFKAFAGEHNVIVYALSQCNREAKGKFPELHELRGSGTKEQDADVVLILHRDISDVDGQSIKEAMIRIAKNRNGRIGDLKLSFDCPTTMFKET